MTECPNRHVYTDFNRMKKNPGTRVYLNIVLTESRGPKKNSNFIEI